MNQPERPASTRSSSPCPMATPPDTPRNVTPTSSSPDAIRSFFVRHLHEHQRTGFDGYDKKAPYVPLECLQAYWTRQRVQQACDGHSTVSNWELIRTDYVRVFSTLVAAGRVDKIRDFVRYGLHDGIFPLERPPAHFPNRSPFLEAFADFAKNQWMFFPLLIPFKEAHDRVIPMKQILPFNTKHPIKSKGLSTIFKVEVDPECNGMIQDSTASPKTYILKVYGEDSSAEYEAEMEAFAVLANNMSKGAPESFLKSYGQYEQGKCLNILLDYMDGGSLGDFIKSHTPPNSPSDIADFWESMGGVLAGLLHFHAPNFSDNVNGDPCVIVHRDLKPDNILLSGCDSDKDSDAPRRPFKFRAVIADFGYSSIQYVRDGEDVIKESTTGGDQIYSAPEVCRRYRHYDRLPTRVSAASDVFSLGAILSELAVWTIFGSNGVREYAQLRIKDHAMLRDFRDSGYEGCFHDGRKALDTVIKMHDKVCHHANDHVTAPIVRLIENKMIQQEPSDRCKARELHDRLNRIVSKARDKAERGNRPLSPAGSLNFSTEEIGSSEAVPRSPTLGESPAMMSNFRSLSINERGRSGTRGRTTSDADAAATSTTESKRLRREWSETEQLSLKQVLQYRDYCKSHEETQFDPNVKRVILNIQKNLKDRDHLFVIDDTPSMSQHRDKILDAFRGLSYIAKSMDSDGIELTFTSNAARKPLKSIRTAPLISALEQHEFVQDAGLMEVSLGQLIRKFVIRRLNGFKATAKRNLSNSDAKPLSLYIFTDGAWGEGSSAACGVDGPIRNLIKALRDGFDRTQIMIQFIQFGNDPDGDRYLKYLDGFGRHEEELDWDIVDTRHIEGNVYAMFFGSISERVDKANDEWPPPGVPSKGTPDQSINRASKLVDSLKLPLERGLSSTVHRSRSSQRPG